MWKYVKKINMESEPLVNDQFKNHLPQESGPLSRTIPSSTIASTNRLKCMEDDNKGNMVNKVLMKRMR